MSKNHKSSANDLTPDRLVQGILSKLGDSFDRLTGRGWRPSSSLATSGLIERLKILLDSQAEDQGDGRSFVPHNIRLKMQWDKFATDSIEPLKKLENELTIAAVDHINDRHYYTHAPLNVEVKPDYFTDGVKLFASFERFSDDENDPRIDVTVPADDLPEDETEVPHRRYLNAAVELSFEVNGKPFVKTLNLRPGQRVSVGRTRENDVAIDDISVSKFHASLLVLEDGTLVVADTGSTNGTYVNGSRMAYGKASPVNEGQNLRFGSVDVDFVCNVEHPIAKPVKRADEPGTERFGEFEFTTRVGTCDDDLEKDQLNDSGKNIHVRGPAVSGEQSKES